MNTNMKCCFTKGIPRYKSVFRDLKLSCLDNMFRCDNGECIQTVYRCDNHTDCQDQSDEAGCGQYRGNTRVVFTIHFRVIEISITFCVTFRLTNVFVINCQLHVNIFSYKISM